MSQPINIRPAQPFDRDAAAGLIHLSMGIEADWLFGQNKRFSTDKVIGSLFCLRGNRMSINHAFVAEQGGQVAGLLLAFPGKLISRLNGMTGLHHLLAVGLAGTIRLARLLSAYGNLIETEPDEFYVSNLAVFPEFQGRGIGTALMGQAEKLAGRSGLNKSSLIVSFGHENARRLYEHLGYRLIATYRSSHPKVAEGSGGFHRMLKNLTPVPVLG